MAVNPQDVLEVVARTEFNGVDDIINVYQYQFDNVVAIDENLVITDILTIIEGLYIAWNAFQSILVLYRDIRIRNVTQNVTYGLFSWPTLIAGAAAAGALPPGNAGVINLDTGVPRVILRKFFGGLTFGSMDADSTLEIATVNALINISLQLITDSVGLSGTYKYGYLSPKVAGFVRPQGAVVSDITGYQRRRKQGRGA